jgi:hypothetical protein
MVYFGLEEQKRLISWHRNDRRCKRMDRCGSQCHCVTARAGGQDPAADIGGGSSVSTGVASCTMIWRSKCYPEDSQLVWRNQEKAFVQLSRRQSNSVSVIARSFYCIQYESNNKESTARCWHRTRKCCMELLFTWPG